MGYITNCLDCGWCVRDKTIKSNKVCINEKSPYYSEVFTEVEAKQKTCIEIESQEAIDYRELTPWGFASKYYM